VSQPAAQFEQHRHVRRWTGTKSAMDGLIQLGRRHNDAQPLGPNPFNMPEDDELCILVVNHISGINILSSPGFDTITPNFKCACKHAPKQNERSWEGVNVLAPHIAALFKLLIAKATIPRSWKEQSSLPCTRRVQ